MGLPHFLRKFAMTEGNEEKQKEIQKIDSRFHGNDRWVWELRKECARMT